METQGAAGPINEEFVTTIENTLEQEACSACEEEQAGLPSEWMAWIVENRLLGVPTERIVSDLTNMGFDPQLVSEEMSRQVEDPCFLAADRLAQRYRTLKAFLDVRYSVNSRAHGAGWIERRSKVSEGEFLDRYYAANKPVILTGLMANSIARQRWTPDYLAEACGEATVQIMSGRDADPRYEINCEAHKRPIRMADYVRMLKTGGPSNDNYLVANNGFFKLPEVDRLYNEVPRFPEYLDHSDGKERTFLWFGPGGTITPLHHDLMNVFVAQIFGRKRFTLIAPEQTPYLYNETGVYSEVDCGKPDYATYPLFREVRPISFIMSPGDVLFLPVGWWHWVRALDTAIMVSYINFKFPNEYEWFHPHIGW
jgi:hypothetical protein